MTDQTNNTNYTFKDIIDDPSLAFWMDVEDLKTVLSCFVSELKEANSDYPPKLLESVSFRKAINREAALVSRVKTRLDDVGKNIVSEWKKQSAQIDARRKIIRDTLDGLRDAVRAPVIKWEEEEAERLAEKEREAAAKAIRDALTAAPHIENQQIDAKAPSEPVDGDHEAPATVAPPEAVKPASGQNLGVFREALAGTIDPGSLEPWPGPRPGGRYANAQRAARAYEAADRVIDLLRETFDIDFLLSGQIDVLSKD